MRNCKQVSQIINKFLYTGVVQNFFKRNCRPGEFFKSTQGSVVTIFAISMIVIMGSAAVAVDYTRLSYIKSDAQSAADAAILAGIIEANRQLQVGKSNKQAITKGENYARDMFKANFPQTLGVIKGELEVDINIDKDGVSGKGKYSKEIKNLLAGIIGHKKSRINVASNASIGTTSHYELHFVIDVSASMGIGATLADITTLKSKINCAFACHSPSNYHGNHKSTLKKAKATGATLRIDVVRDAVMGVVQQIKSKSINNKLKVAVHGFSNNTITLQEATADYDLALDNIADLTLTKKVDEGGTNFSGVFRQLNRLIKKSGKGTSAYNPKRIVVFISDGFQSHHLKYGSNGIIWNNTAGFVPYNGVNPQLCDYLKNTRKSEIYTITVKRLDPRTGRAVSNNEVAERNMAKCATSENHAFKAETPKDIEDAFQIFLSQIIGKLRITS